MRYQITDSQMHEEIMEVVDDLRLQDKDIDFLNDVEERAGNDALSEKQRAWLEDIYDKACALDESHHS